MKEYNYDEIIQEISRLKKEKKQKEEQYDGILEELTSYQEAVQEQYELAIQEQSQDEEPIENRPEYQLNLIGGNINDLDSRINYWLDIVDLIDEGNDYKRIYSDYQFAGIIKSHDGNVEKDLLNRKKAAYDVAGRILRENIKSTAIFGKWGTGKTAFLQFISEGLESKAKLNNRKIETITIDASAYSDQNQIWAYIYEKVRERFYSNYLNRVKYVVMEHWMPLMPIIALLLIMNIMNIVEVQL